MSDIDILGQVCLVLFAIVFLILKLVKRERLLNLNSNIQISLIMLGIVSFGGLITAVMYKLGLLGYYLIKKLGNLVIYMINLPEYCFTDNDGEVVIVRKNMDGYFPCSNISKRTANEMNAELNITKSQEMAMVVGSMFGWGCDAANPNNYDENGIYKK